MPLQHVQPTCCSVCFCSGCLSFASEVASDWPSGLLDFCAQELRAFKLTSDNICGLTRQCLLQPGESAREAPRPLTGRLKEGFDQDAQGLFDELQRLVQKDLTSSQQVRGPAKAEQMGCGLQDQEQVDAQLKRPHLGINFIWPVPHQKEGRPSCSPLAACRVLAEVEQKKEELRARAAEEAGPQRSLVPTASLAARASQRSLSSSSASLWHDNGFRKEPVLLVALGGCAGEDVDDHWFPGLAFSLECSCSASCLLSSTRKLAAWPLVMVSEAALGDLMQSLLLVIDLFWKRGLRGSEAEARVELT